MEGKNVPLQKLIAFFKENMLIDFGVFGEPQISFEDPNCGVDSIHAYANINDIDPPGPSGLNNEMDYNRSSGVDESWESIREMFDLGRSLTYSVESAGSTLELRTKIHKTLTDLNDLLAKSADENIQDYRGKKKRQRR